MSPDPHLHAPPDVASRFASRARPDEGQAGEVTRRLDGSTWSDWRLDLIVERSRVADFDDVMPLPPATRCPWAARVALGQVVELSLAATYCHSDTSRLVANALEVAGFGVVREVADAPEGDRAHRWASPRPVAVDVRAAVLGTIADALLRGVTPSTRADVDADVVVRELDRRTPTVPSAVGPDGIEAVVRRATREAVMAYARQVEAVAEGSRHTTRRLRSAHERVVAVPVLVR